MKLSILCYFVLQMLSPKNAGLFKRAISQSGVGLCSWVIQDDPLTWAKKVMCTSAEGPQPTGGGWHTGQLVACTPTWAGWIVAVSLQAAILKLKSYLRVQKKKMRFHRKEHSKYGI